MERRYSYPKTYYVELNNNGLIDYAEEDLIQIMAGDTIIFHLHSGIPIISKCLLLINFPNPEQGEAYQKVTKPIVPLKRKTVGKNKKNDIRRQLLSIEPIIKPFGAVEFEVKFPVAGSFFYQIEYFDIELQETNITDPDWIIVNPYLYTANITLPIESLSVQTVLSRCLGKLKDWPQVIEAQSKLGYNAIHFLPIQAYGMSGNMYSIRDQLSIDDCYFEDTKISSDERIFKVKEVLNEISNNQNVICFIDIVLNHTAVNSDWLLDHPEAAYNLHNSPYLNVAWEFDKFLMDFSQSFSKREIAECPNAPYIANKRHLQTVMKALKGRVKSIPLYQYFMYDKETVREQFEEALEVMDEAELLKLKAIEVNMVNYIINHSHGYGSKPFGVTLDVYKVGAVMMAKSLSSKKNLWKELNEHLDNCNSIWKVRFETFLTEALNNIEATIRYEKLELMNTRITTNNPLVKNYFTKLNIPPKEGRHANEYIVVHNGWSTVSEDITSPLGFYYLRRLVYIWDDNVRLYYGKKKEDNPYLWTHMEKYITLMVGIFKGIRIDNCHCIPIRVLEYFVNYARFVNPNLFVFAELFSDKPKTDSYYARCLGLNAIIKESSYINSTSSLVEMMKKSIEPFVARRNIDYHYFPNGKKAQKLIPTKPRIILYDITHDNNSPKEIWNSQAILPLICSLSTLNTAIGSTKGVDELLPMSLSVVSEKRQYKALVDIENPVYRIGRQEDQRTSFVYTGNAKRVALAGSFNSWSTTSHLLLRTDVDRWEIGLKLNPGRYLYKFVVNDKDWVLGSGPTEKDLEGNINNVISIPEIKESNEKVAVYNDLRMVRKIMNRVHFNIGNNKSNISIDAMNDVIVVIQELNNTDDDEEDEISSYVLVTKTIFNKEYTEHENIVRSVPLPGKLDNVLLVCSMDKELKDSIQDAKYINGSKGRVYDYLGVKQFARVVHKEDIDILEFYKIPASFCVIVTTKLTSRQIKISRDLNAMRDPPIYNLNISSINHLLFRSIVEEQEFVKNNRVTYKLGKMVPKYAGIAGLVYGFNKCKESDSKEILNSIQEGDWLIDYNLRRIKDYTDLREIFDWLSRYLASIKELPSKQKPKWFIQVITKLFYASKQAALKSAPEFFKQDEFSSSLILSTCQFISYLPSATYRNYKITMAAGLPNNCIQGIRCLGRDTMIALPGLLVIPNWLREARSILLMFAAVSRHGLIPHIYGQGDNARFNTRDTTWYFMEALQQYIRHDKENGESILKEQLNMQFLSANQAQHAEMKLEGRKLFITLEELIQDIMQSHFQGIDFVEWEAGRQVDESIVKEEFHITIRTDTKTGFIYGGNKSGTWMDFNNKERNEGLCARDGANIEIIGLLRSTLRFLSELYEKNVYPYEGVISSGKLFTYKKWGRLIDENFEKCFWIPEEPSEWSEYQINPKLIQQTGIYKDLIGSSDPSAQYSFRPNFTIAMVVAPEMFVRRHAAYAINRVKAELVGGNSIGVKVVHPFDRVHKENIGLDRSHRISSYMELEWVWLYGYFLRAYILFAKHTSTQELEVKMVEMLKNHKKYLLSSPWMSLPEVTKANGEESELGNKAHASSIGCIIEAINEFNNYLKNH